MNNEEFYSEIQEYEKKRFELHQKYQSIAVEIFKEFHRVCIKNNIAYYGVYGTLLGALRDDGFIPWDLDVDTIVAIEDIDRLRECLKRDLGNEYYVISEEDKEFPYYQLRVCKKGYDYRIHVDVFYLFGLPRDKAAQKRLANKSADLFHARFVKMHSYDVDADPLRKRVWLWKKKKIRCLLYSFLSIKTIDKKIRYITMKYPIKDAAYVCALCDELCIYDKAVLGTPVLCHAALADMYVPEKADEFLNLSYGHGAYVNWHEYMPIEDRYKEYMHGVHLAEDMEKKRNTEKSQKMKESRT